VRSGVALCSILAVYEISENIEFEVELDIVDKVELARSAVFEDLAETTSSIRLVLCVEVELLPASSCSHQLRVGLISVCKTKV